MNLPPTHASSRRTPPTLRAACLVAICLVTLPAPADEVRLKDGSVLYGIIGGAEAGTLSISPGFDANDTRVFKYKLEDILSFGTDDSIYVGTGSEASKRYESVTFGRVEGTATGIRLKTSVGSTDVPISLIKAAWRNMDDSPHERERKKLERSWALELFTDLNGRRGNKDLLGVTAGLTATNAGVSDTLVFKVKYNYYETHREISSDNLAAGGDYQSNLTDRWTWYVRTNDGFNKINHINFFSESGLGAGFYLIKEENQKLEIRAGLGFRYESYTNRVASDLKEAGLDTGWRYEYAWDWGKFGNSVTYMPAFNNWGRFLLRHESYLEVPVGNTKNWWVRFGIANNYDSHPAPSVKKLDTIYGVQIVWRFK